MRSSRILYYSLFFGLMISLINCAKRGTPTGGPKDETPPEIEDTDPENYSLEFEDDEITITFNEFVSLKDAQKQLVVSPPLKYPPEVSPQGGASRDVTIKLLDTLRENTTYVFNFGQSIVDHNEGNPYPFYRYVFSTGSYIDSLELGGLIKDATQKEPDNYISVMLYEFDSTYSDSAVYRKQPTYITNTLDSAVDFRLTNLKKGKYRLIALKDEGSDNLFTPKTDKIGFIADTITIPTDTTYQITLFQEVPDFRVTRPSQLNKDKIAFGFEGDPTGMEIELLSDTPDDFRYTTIRQKDKDSINYYFTPFEADSLIFKVGKEKVIDTFTVRIRDLYRDSLEIQPVQKGSIQLNDTIRITGNIPLESYNKDNIQILNQDSTAVSFELDLNNKTNELRFLYPLEPGSKYNIAMYPGAVSDFFGKENDSLQFSINTKEIGQLGTIRVKLQNVDEYPVLLELTDNQDRVKQSMFIKEPRRSYDFINIDPGTYYMRIIHDTNGNGKWDTGNYLQMLQPEKISYYPEEIELRANWEIEQTFILD